MVFGFLIVLKRYFGLLVVHLLLEVVHHFGEVGPSISGFTQFLRGETISLIHNVLDYFLLIVDASTRIILNVLLPLSTLLL